MQNTSKIYQWKENCGKVCKVRLVPLSSMKLSKCIRLSTLLWLSTSKLTWISRSIKIQGDFAMDWGRVFFSLRPDREIIWESWKEKAVWSWFVATERKKCKNGQHISALRHGEVSRAQKATVNGKKNCYRREQKDTGTDCVHFISVNSNSWFPALQSCTWKTAATVPVWA